MCIRDRFYTTQVVGSMAIMAKLLPPSLSVQKLNRIISQQPISHILGSLNTRLQYKHLNIKIKCKTYLNNCWPSKMDNTLCICPASQGVIYSHLILTFLVLFNFFSYLKKIHNSQKIKVNMFA